MRYVQDNWKLIVGLAWLVATPSLWAEDAIRSHLPGRHQKRADSFLHGADQYVV